MIKPNTTVIETTDLQKTYRLGNVDVHALRGVSLRIEQGEFVAIMGQSGSGKSTLMHILGLLDRPDGGTFLLDGRDAAQLGDAELADLRARRIGFVFQQFNLLPRMTAHANVSLPLIYNDNPAARPSDLLRKVGLADRELHAPSELSGGQQQRVAIARALVNNPRVLMADEPTGNLDSRSSEEIMGIIRDLHKAGLTIIVVTHDAEIGAMADRVIVMRDGRIVEDRHNDAVNRLPAAAASAAPPLGDQPKARTWLRKSREGISMLKQAGRSLAANKTRTLLSMLGVLIGVAAVISVMALGTGAKQAVEERISSMGANLLMVRPGNRQSGGVALGAGEVSRLTLDDVTALENEIPGVAHAAPLVNGNAQVTYAGNNWRTQVVGTSPSYGEMHDLLPEYGRFFNQGEVDDRSRVAVVGLTVASELFGDESPVGRTIRINRLSFRVVGVLPDSGASFHRDPNDQIIIPVTTAMRRLFGETYVNHLEVQAESSDDMEYLEMASVDLLKRRHRISADDDEAYHVFNLADIQEAMTATSDTMSMLLGGIGAISLLVGGIGIMNIMLVSVTERTREIGIRKAVGARRNDILAQFLVESVVVSMCGGALGIALGWSGSLAMTHLAGWTTVVTSQTVAVAFAFSAAVGVVFGLWPARKASSLNPVEALRYE